MSSYPFKSGVPVLNNTLYSFPDHFFLRSTDKAASDEKIRRLKRKLPIGVKMRIHEVGFRPDHPVPVAMYFCEVFLIGRRREWKDAKIV